MFRATRLLAALAILATNATADAQSNKASSSQLCVDLVRLKSGKTMRGVVLRNEANGSVTMAVPRAWLRKTYPDVFVKLTQDELSLQRKALEQLRDRLRKALNAVTEETRLTAFLTRELKRVDKLLVRSAPPEALQFIWFDGTKNKIAKVTRSTADRRRIAVWAWFEELPNVESRDAGVLARELKQKGVDPGQPPPDLSDRLPPRLQDDREWAARMALAAYSLGESLDFQGTGDLLVRSDKSADTKDTAPVIAKLLSQQLDLLVRDLLGNIRPAARDAGSSDDWLKPVVREAESRKARAFRATRVDLNLNGHQALVYSVFVVRLDNGDWKTVWSDREMEDTAKPRAAIEETISKDPQVKSALAAIRSLGGITDDRLQQAIRCGAATMAAQKSVDSRFFAFQESLLKRLDGPPLWWTK